MFIKAIYFLVLTGCVSGEPSVLKCHKVEATSAMVVDCGKNVGDAINVTYCGSASGLSGITGSQNCLASTVGEVLYIEDIVARCGAPESNTTNTVKYAFVAYNIIIRQNDAMYTIQCIYKNGKSSSTISLEHGDKVVVFGGGNKINNTAHIQSDATLVEQNDIPFGFDLENPQITNINDIMASLRKYTKASLIVTSKNKTVHRIKEDSKLQLHLRVQALINDYSARAMSCDLEDGIDKRNSINLFHNGCAVNHNMASRGFSHKRFNSNLNIRLTSPEFKLPAHLKFPEGFYVTCNLAICQGDSCIQTCPAQSDVNFDSSVIKNLKVSYGKMKIGSLKQRVIFPWEQDMPYYIVIGVLFILILFVLIVIIILAKNYRARSVERRNSLVHGEEYTPGKKPTKKPTAGADSGYNKSPQLPPFPSFDNFETVGRSKSNEVTVPTSTFPSRLESRPSMDGLDTEERNIISGMRRNIGEAGSEEEQIFLVNNKRPDGPSNLTKL